MKRFFVTMMGLVALLVLLVAWNIGSGSVSVTAEQMCEVLFRKTTEGTFYHIVWDNRIPLMLAALFLGG